ncbi:MAG: hypothetical protein ACON4Z_01035 [Planctomycetota bacterium]
MRRTAALLSLAILPLQGCCSVARAWCGPDETPWVSVDFRTPELATRTLLEALRRDDPGVVYDALADDLREQLGLDGLTVELAWPKIRAQYPYLHVAGYAAVPPAATAPDGASARVVVTLEGRRLALELVRQTYWELRYRRPGAELSAAQRDARVGRRITSPEEVVTVELDLEADDDRSLVALRPQVVAHFGVDEIPAANVDSVAVFHAWKVRRLSLLADGPAAP